MEGESRALTQSDSSRSWDINLVCHSAVSRRRPRALEQMAAVPAPVTAWGSSSRGSQSSWGGLGDTQDTCPQLPPWPWLPGVLQVSPLTGLDDAESPGVSPALDPVSGIAWMETIRLITAHTDEHGGKEMDSRGLSGCGTACVGVQGDKIQEV